MSGALRGCGAGWRWGARGAVRGAAAASGRGHIKFGGCGRRGGGAAGEALRTGAEPEWPPPPPFHCDRRVRPRRRRRRGAGAGGGGGRRAAAGGGGRNRPQLGPGQPPALRAVSGGTRSQSPPPTEDSPRPGRGALASAGLSPSLSWSLPLPSFPFSFLHKFLNFDELARRTFLKGPRCPSPRAVELGAGRPCVPRHPRPGDPTWGAPTAGLPQLDSRVVGFRK